MRLSRLFVLLAVVLVTTACTPWVKTEFNPSANFSQLQTFAWVAPKHGKVGDPILDSQLLDERVHDAVNRTLTARGFEPGAADSADFLVTYHTTKSTEVRSSPFAAGVGVGRYWRDPFLTPYPFYGSVVIASDVQSYDEGTLIIDLIDARTHKLIWRGWRTHALVQKYFDAAAVQATVKEILDHFPPGREKASAD